MYVYIDIGGSRASTNGIGISCLFWCSHLLRQVSSDYDID